MAPVKLAIQTRSGKTLCTIDIDSDATVVELKKKFFAAKKTYYPARQRFSLPPAEGQTRGVALEDSKALNDYKLVDGSVLLFKDLGPQIGYSTVFFLEYLGPLLLYPIFYQFPNICYFWWREPVPRYPVQQLALLYWSFHYAKRIVETFTLHKFGHSTMPIFNLFKNCGYYWGFAVYVAFFINHPLFTPPRLIQTQVALALAMVCQLSNLWCHVILANLRQPGDKAYKIPRGFLFNYITCANYTTEIWGWILFGVATQTAAVFVFIAAGTFQMAQWAKQKHSRLVKLFDGKEGRERYPRNRWIMLPPFF